MLNNRFLSGLTSLIFILFLLTVYIQAQTFLNWDVSFLMHASEKLLAGGSYTNDFFETNPPLILFLYIPSILLSQFFKITLVTSLRIYVFGLISLSLVLCWHIGKNIFLSTHKDYFRFTIFTLSVATSLLFLPAHDFGQREHLTIALIFPYLLICSLRLSSTPVSARLASLVGVMAGIGFGLKPFFLIPFIFIEFTLFLYQRKIRTLIKPETIAILSVLTLYIFLVFLITPDYVFVIAPLLLHLYYPSISMPFSTLLLQTHVMFFFGCILLFIISWKKNIFWELRVIFLIATVSFMLVYFLEGTSWHYHSLPAFTLSIVSIIFLCSICFSFIPNSFLINASYLCYWIVCLIVPAGFIFILNSQAMNKTISSQLNLLYTLQSLKSLNHNKSCYILSISGYYFSVVVDYAGKKNVNRFPNYWWLPGLIKLNKGILSPKEKNKLEKEKAFFIQAIVQDIEKFKPDLILVDSIASATDLNGKKRNYFTYFANAQFNHLFDQYHPVLKTQQFTFYERKPLNHPATSFA